MKIAVLCNGRLALPALTRLLEEKRVVTIGIADNKADIVQVFSWLATQHNVPLQVFTQKGFGAQLRTWLHEFSPNVVFVMTYPFRIPAAALTIPPLGFINFHYGLLPEMRGADPIFESIRQRRAVAGTTIHVMDAALDTGPIIMREEMPLHPHYTYGMLSAQLAYQGAELCAKLVDELSANGRIIASPQDETCAAYYPKLPASGVYLEWQRMEAAQLLALINSCNPMSTNGVPTLLNGWTIGVCFASVVKLTGDASAYPTGSILAIDPQNGLLVLAMDGVALKLDIIYTEEGYFPGYKLAEFGITTGMVFSDPS